MGSPEQKLTVMWQDLVEQILTRLQAKSYHQLSSCWGRQRRQQHHPFLNSIALLVWWKLGFCCLSAWLLCWSYQCGASLYCLYPICPLCHQETIRYVWVLSKSM